MKLRKILAHPIWFLIGSFIFGIGGVRYLINDDTTGAVVYLVAGFLFLVGFFGQVLSRKRK